MELGVGTGSVNEQRRINSHGRSRDAGPLDRGLLTVSACGGGDSLLLQHPGSELFPRDLLPVILGGLALAPDEVRPGHIEVTQVLVLLVLRFRYSELYAVVLYVHLNR